MKKFMIVAACAALAACGSNEEAETPVVTDATATAPAGTTDTATASQMAGTYEVTMDDGTVVRQTVNADGTYVDSDMQGTELDRGTWRQEGDQLCYDPDGNDPEECFTGGTPGPDGSFEVRNAAGEVASTVRRIENDAGATMMPAE